MTGFNGMDGWGRYSNFGAHGLISKSHDRRGMALLGYGDSNTGNVGTGVASFEWSSNGVGGMATDSSVGKWVNFTYVFSNSQQQAKLFANGILVGTKAGFSQSLASINSQDLYLGKYSDSWYPLNGSLDEVKIYNRALTEAEVLELYSGKAITAVDLENSPNPIFSAIKFMVDKLGEYGREKAQNAPEIIAQNRMDEALSAIPVVIGSISKHPYFKNTFSTNVSTKVAKQLEDDIRTKLSLKITKLDVGKAVLGVVADDLILFISNAVFQQTNNRAMGGAAWFFLKQTYSLADAALSAKGNPIAFPAIFLSTQAGLLVSVIQKDIEEFYNANSASEDEAAALVRLRITQNKGAVLASAYQDYFRAENTTQKTVFRNKIASEQRRLLQPYLSGDIFNLFKTTKKLAAQKVYNDWLKDLSGRLVKEEFEVKANIAALVRLDKDAEAKRISTVLTGSDSYALELIAADNAPQNNPPLLP